MQMEIGSCLQTVESAQIESEIIISGLERFIFVGDTTRVHSDISSYILMETYNIFQERFIPNLSRLSMRWNE